MASMVKTIPFIHYWHKIFAPTENEVLLKMMDIVLGESSIHSKLESM